MLLGGLTAVATAIAAASALGQGGGRIGAAEAVVASCDDAVFVRYLVSNGSVTGVQISGLADPACEGGQLRFTVSDASWGVLAQAGPVTIPTDGDNADNTVQLSLTPSPTYSSVAHYSVVIVGP